MTDETDLPHYRLVTGPDGADFCGRVSALLDAGYELHASPAITADPGARSPLHRLDHSVRRRWAVARDGSGTVPEYCSYSRAAAWSPQPREIFDEAL